MESRRVLTAFIMVDNPLVVEGTGSPSAASFSVKLVLPSTSTVQVDYTTANRGAVAGVDYTATSGTLTFAPGETVKKVSVPIIPDAVPESNEAFVLNLSNPQNAQIFTPVGVGTIIDDDNAVAPALSVLDVQMGRGLSGVRTANFTVKLNAAQTSRVTVTASTANLTAIAGVEYAAKTELLSFAPGETTKTFSVNIFGTATTTPDKVFMVKLTGTTASLTRGTAYGVLRYGV